jgi:ParB/RepB/Spo0J family partition protein
METRKIKISKIEINDDRVEGGKGDIESLARNLDRYGQINAVTVVKAGAGSDYIYRVIAGRRRIAAAKLLGWEEIRADVYESGEIDSANEEMIALSENAAREEMNAIDEGVLYANELKKGTPVEELAALFCRNKKTVYQRARLASLIPEMRGLYKDGKLPLYIAAMAADLPEDAQKKCAEKAKGKSWGTISEWEVKGIISEVTNDRLEKLGICEKCLTCNKRTRHSDRELFPEISDSGDRCFDHECFLRSLKIKIETEFENFKKGCGSKVFRILTDEDIPENLNLSFRLEEIPEDVEDITDPSPDEYEIKTKLKSLGKIEYVAFWNGTRFEIRDIAKETDIEELSEKSDDDEPSEWEKSQMEEINDVCRNIPESDRNPVLESPSKWWETRRDIGEKFLEKMKSAVMGGKGLEKEIVALFFLLKGCKEEFEEFFPDAGLKDEPPCSNSLYEKLLEIDKNILVRALLNKALGDYGVKPGVVGLEKSDWPKVFRHIGIDLAELRDEAVRETIGVGLPEEKKSKENLAEDIEKFGVFDDDVVE